MGFPQNILSAIILGLITSFIMYKIYHRKHWLFKYMLIINILYIIYILILSLSLNFRNSLEMNELFSMFIIFYLLIFVPLFIIVGYLIIKKFLSYEWDSKGLTYFLAVVWTFTVITLLLIVCFIIGFYIFIYLFYGFIPEFLLVESIVK